jgi:TPR repeat protein
VRLHESDLDPGTATGAKIPDEPGWHCLIFQLSLILGVTDPNEPGRCRMRGSKGVDRADRRLSDFAQRLAALRVRSGEPSYAQLARLTHDSRYPQPASSIHDKVAGKYLASEDFVKVFVGACAVFANERGRPLSPTDRDLSAWVADCKSVRREVLEHRRKRRPAIRQDSPADSALRPANRWNPVRLGVHPVIQVPERPSWQPSLPEYLERPHDRRMRTLLRQRMDEPKMVTLVGGSSTGKTRAAYEAVLCCFPEWPLLVPATASELIEFLASGEVDTECVLWLDEAQNYLADPVAARAVRNLLCQGHGNAVVMATLWPAHWSALSALAEDEAEDPSFESRRLLELVVRVDVPQGFDFTDVERARQLGRVDQLLATAVRSCGPRGELTQALAAGPGLVHRYNDIGPFAKAVLTAAMDARRLGCSGLLTDEHLREAAVGYLGDDVRAGGARDWFGRALRESTAKVMGAVAPLTPVRIKPGVGDADGYRLADFLDQYGRSELRGQAAPRPAWNAFIEHISDPADRTSLAREAARRGLLEYASLLAVPAAHCGASVAMGVIAAQLQRAGNSEGAAEWWARAAGQGDSDSMCHLARHLEDQDDQQEANRWWKKGADQGNPYAVWQWADRLYRDGHATEAEQVLRCAAEAGEPYALKELTSRLEEQHRYAEAEVLCRSVVQRGHLASAQAVAGILQLSAVLARGERGAEAERTLRRAATEGHCAAMYELAVLLERTDRDREAAEWCDRAARDEYAPAVLRLATRYLNQKEAGRAAECLRSLADAGNTYAIWQLADLEDRAGRPTEADAMLERGIAYGDAHALTRLTGRLVQSGRLQTAEAQLRHAVENGVTGGLLKLAQFLELHGRTTEARRLLRYGIEPGGRTSGPWGLDPA